MKLHELEKDKIYIGEDGKEYKHDGWHLMDCLTLTAVICYAPLTQNFTPKKVKRTVEEVQWFSVAAWRKTERHPFIPVHLFASEEEFLSLFSTSKEDYHWVKLIPVCKTHGSSLVEE